MDCNDAAVALFGGVAREQVVGRHPADFTRRLRVDPAYRDLPVIALTANTMEGDRARCLSAGMNDFVSKPLRIDDLLVILARWITPGSGASPTAANPRPMAQW